MTNNKWWTPENKFYSSLRIDVADCKIFTDNELI